MIFLTYKITGFFFIDKLISIFNPTRALINIFFNLLSLEVFFPLKIIFRFIKLLPTIPKIKIFVFTLLSILLFIKLLIKFNSLSNNDKFLEIAQYLMTTFLLKFLLNKSLSISSFLNIKSIFLHNLHIFLFY